MSWKWRAAIWPLNLALFLLFAGLWAHASFLLRLGGAVGAVTELDRAGVINEEALRAYDPNLAENTRYTLGLWVAERERQEAIWIAGFATVAALFNLIVWSIAWAREKPRTSGGQGADGPPGGSAEGAGCVGPDQRAGS